MRTTEFIVSLVGTDVLGGPTQSQMNFLSARGLGGAHALATAKASGTLAPTVYPCETIYFL